MIVVLATDHPQRDDWVDREALDEADRSGEGELPPYQGVARIPPDGVPVHVFADPATFDAFHRWWLETLDEDKSTEGDTT